MIRSWNYPKAKKLKIDRKKTTKPSAKNYGHLGYNKTKALLLCCIPSSLANSLIEIHIKNESWTSTTIPNFVKKQSVQYSWR